MFENKLFCDFSCLFQLFNVSLHHKLIIKSQRYGKNSALMHAGIIGMQKEIEQGH